MQSLNALYFNSESSDYASSVFKMLNIAPDIRNVGLKVFNFNVY